MKIEYVDLISPSPFIIQQTGSIRRHTLREITQLTAGVYATYLALLHMTPALYCTEINKNLDNWYGNLTDKQKDMITMYDIAAGSTSMQQSFQSVLNFFFAETVRYDKDADAFLLLDNNETVIGSIDKRNYSEMCDIILQLNHIETKEEVNLSNVRNKKGLERYKEMQAKKKQQKSSEKCNTDLELGNIISAVCTKHNSLNYTNIWDLTVYQLWDTFSRLCTNDIYDTSKTSVSVWGDKENKFNFNLWYKTMR